MSRLGIGPEGRLFRQNLSGQWESITASGQQGRIGVEVSGPVASGCARIAYPEDALPSGTIQIQSGSLLSGFVLASGPIATIPIQSGSLVSGRTPVSGYVIASGQLVTPLYVSGLVNWPSPDITCGNCKKVINPEDPCVLLLRIPIKNLNASLCAECIGYDRLNKRFFSWEDHVRDYLRQDIPLESGTPDYILADWLEERGRVRDSELFRNLPAPGNTSE